MIVRKVLLVACAAALTTTPAWALGGQRPAPDANPGSDHRSPKAERHEGPSDRGRPDRSARSRRCEPRRVAYVAAGMLVGHTLVMDGSDPVPTISAAAARGGDRPTYSGDVTIDVRRTNRHARPDKGTTKTYTLDHARVLLRIPDLDGDEAIDLADVVPGSRAKVIGKITRLPRHCDHSEFEPQLKIRTLLIHAPRPAA